MRITSGLLKGRKILSPPVKNLRLTEEKVRKAIFDILGDCIKEISVLELFAGSGVLGIEALSRGAREVTFVESDRRCIATIKKNIPLEMKERSFVFTGDCIRAIEHFATWNKKFDIVIMDPPYKKGLADLVLKKLYYCCILKPYSIVVVEHHRDEMFDEVFLKKLNLISQKKYGDTWVSFFRLSDEKEK